MINFLPYSLDILRAADRDRYISVLFAPKKKRRALAALYAFNAEIARIRENVHNPLSVRYDYAGGTIRLLRVKWKRVKAIRF